jgi:hypothetical protein
MGGINEVCRRDWRRCHDIYTPSFIKNGSRIRKLTGAIHRQQGDLISLLLFFQNKASWLKITIKVHILKNKVIYYIKIYNYRKMKDEVLLQISIYKCMQMQFNFQYTFLSSKRRWTLGISIAAHRLRTTVLYGERVGNSFSLTIILMIKIGSITL